jgi:aldehyde dehydrogenase family 7 protein A1
MPGPKRGEVVRQMREVLASKVGELGDLVSLEMGKLKSEGKGEVQEVCEACGRLLMIVCGHREASHHSCKSA